MFPSIPFYRNAAHVAPARFPFPCFPIEIFSEEQFLSRQFRHSAHAEHADAMDVSSSSAYAHRQREIGKSMWRCRLGVAAATLACRQLSFSRVFKHTRVGLPAPANKTSTAREYTAQIVNWRAAGVSHALMWQLKPARCQADKATTCCSLIVFVSPLCFCQYAARQNALANEAAGSVYFCRRLSSRRFCALFSNLHIQDVHYISQLYRVIFPFRADFAFSQLHTRFLLSQVTPATYEVVSWRFYFSICRINTSRQ